VNWHTVTVIVTGAPVISQIIIITVATYGSIVSSGVIRHVDQPAHDILSLSSLVTSQAEHCWHWVSRQTIRYWQLSSAGAASPALVLVAHVRWIALLHTTYYTIIIVAILHRYLAIR